MYENGRKVNRHAAQEIHRDKMKRKFTPLQYSSYESYVEDEENQNWFKSSWTQNKINTEKHLC